MRSTNLPLFDLFQRQRRYVVPLFQRPYVWEQEEQWEPLWQDIAGRAEAVLERDSRGSRSDRIRSHVLGAIVLNQIKVYGRQVDTVEVIDGQPPPNRSPRPSMPVEEVQRKASFRELLEGERRRADNDHSLAVPGDAGSATVDCSACEVTEGRHTLAVAPPKRDDSIGGSDVPDDYLAITGHGACSPTIERTCERGQQPGGHRLTSTLRAGERLPLRR